MRTYKLFTYLIAVGIFAVVALIGIFYIQPLYQIQAATGSNFTIQHEFVQGGVAGATTTTLTAISTTTPIHLVPNSTTTISVRTNGVSDLRLNYHVIATSTGDALGATITTIVSPMGRNNIERYYEPVLSTSGSVITLTQFQTFSWITATSTNNAPSGATQPLPATISLPINNLNSSRVVIEIGSDIDVDIHVEIVKIIPTF